MVKFLQTIFCNRREFSSQNSNNNSIASIQRKISALSITSIGGKLKKALLDKINPSNHLFNQSDHSINQINWSIYQINEIYQIIQSIRSGSTKWDQLINLSDHSHQSDQSNQINQLIRCAAHRIVGAHRIRTRPAFRASNRIAARRCPRALALGILWSSVLNHRRPMRRSVCLPSVCLSVYLSTFQIESPRPSYNRQRIQVYRSTSNRESHRINTVFWI